MHREIQEAALIGHIGCIDVVQATWLGSPIIPNLSEQSAIRRIQIMLNSGVEPARGNLGEAETIYFAERLNGIVVTDDNHAFNFVEHRLGVGRAVDSVGLLRQAVSSSAITSATAVEIVDAVRGAGRRLRRVHPEVVRESYFE